MPDIGRPDPPSESTLVRRHLLQPANPQWRRRARAYDRIGVYRCGSSGGQEHNPRVGRADRCPAARRTGISTIPRYGIDRTEPRC